MKFSHRGSSPRRSADPAVVTQWAYIAEAAFEYFVTLTMSGAFLTLLVKQMGVSDALAGILSGISTLACGVQVFSITFIRRRRSIRVSVLFMQTLQQLLSAFLFLLPFVPLGSDAARLAVFAALFLFSGILTNLVAPAKFNWMMSFVAPNNRGVFTAHKEMLSLVTGLTYNLLMSRAVDRCDAAGHPETGLRLCAGVLLGLTVCHAVSLLAAHDAPEILADARTTSTLRASVRTNFANRSFVRILMLTLGWNFFAFLSISYYNVYLLQELDTNVTFIAVAGIVGSAVRFAFSVPIGRLSDRRGFARSVDLGFLLAAGAFALLTFWVPANGKILYLLYQMPYSTALAALAGGLLNIIFQYVPPKDRVGAQGIYAALGGIAGFAGSLTGGWILGAVQAAGNRVFGIPLYGQQLLSLLTAVGLFGMFIYGRLVVERMERFE